MNKIAIDSNENEIRELSADEMNMVVGGDGEGESIDGGILVPGV